jgi:hypothetical protein
MQASLKKTIALVIALAMYNNYCIDERDAQVPPSRTVDELRTEMQGGIPLQTSTTSTDRDEVFFPRQLLDGGRHFDDIVHSGRRRQIRQYQYQADASHQQLPRDFYIALLQKPTWPVPCPGVLIVPNSNAFIRV